MASASISGIICLLPVGSEKQGCACLFSERLHLWVVLRTWSQERNSPSFTPFICNSFHCRGTPPNTAQTSLQSDGFLCVTWRGQCCCGLMMCFRATHYIAVLYNLNKEPCSVRFCCYIQITASMHVDKTHQHFLVLCFIHPSHAENRQTHSASFGCRTNTPATSSTEDDLWILWGEMDRSFLAASYHLPFQSMFAGIVILSALMSRES